MTPVERELYRHFATLLNYPTEGLGDAAWACAALLDGAHPDAARLVQSFAAFVDATPAGRLEETYSAVFDLDAAAPPYVGYHLFGESYKRSTFLLRLRQAYRAAGVDPGRELPDHVAPLLALLAATEDAELRAELVEEALVPTLERMVNPARDDDDGADRPSDRPVEGRQAYVTVLRALQLVLSARPVGEGRS